MSTVHFPNSRLFGGMNQNCKHRKQCKCLTSSSQVHKSTGYIHG